MPILTSGKCCGAFSPYAGGAGPWDAHAAGGVSEGSGSGTACGTDTSASIHIGEPVDAAVLAGLPSDHPLRLIRIDANAWERELSPPLESADVVDQISGANLWQNDRYADLAAPEPTGAIVKASETSVVATGASSGSPMDRLPVRPALACGSGMH